jgi:hypothetical protein
MEFNTDQIEKDALETGLLLINKKPLQVADIDN